MQRKIDLPRFKVKTLISLQHSHMKIIALLLASVCLTAAAMAQTADPNALLNGLVKEQETQKGVFAVPRNQASVNRYFTKDLAALINKDDSQSAKTGELGAIAFDILYYSQDPQIKNLSVAKAVVHEGETPNNANATIEMTYKDNGQAAKTRVMFIQSKSGWKIEDIVYGDGNSLKSLLLEAYPRKTGQATDSGAPNGPEVIQSYVAHLTSRDHVSSSGSKLTTAAEILRQDRANVHKFDKADAADEADTFFAGAANRELLGALLEKGDMDKKTEAAIVNGTPTVVVTLNASGKTAQEYLSVALN